MIPHGGDGCTCKQADDRTWITNYCEHHDPILRMMRGEHVEFNGLRSLVDHDGPTYDDLA